jgi:hypothetical protein
VFIELQIAVDPCEDGNDFAPDGHVNMLDAKSQAAALSGKARLLSREETLGG